MEDSIEQQITRIDGQILQAKLYAKWWMIRAITGEAINRDMYHGTGDEPHTEQEKLSDAINTANTHIKKIGGLVEIKIKLMKQHKTSFTQS